MCSIIKFLMSSTMSAKNLHLKNIIGILSLMSIALEEYSHLFSLIVTIHQTRMISLLILALSCLKMYYSLQLCAFKSIPTKDLLSQRFQVS